MPIHDNPGSVFRHRLVRRVLGVRGQLTFRVEVEPRFDYGRASHSVVFHENGAVFRSADISLALETATPLRPSADGVTCEITLAAGESATFVLERVQEDYVPRPYSEDETREAFDRTIEYWRRWLSKSRYQGRWREIVHRSALTLKLLTFLPTGGIVAAPTTSLPEQLGGGRNWDYRYTWIRDAAFSLYALLRLGFTEEAAAFMEWLRGRFGENRGGELGPLQIMYGIDGRAELGGASSTTSRATAARRRSGSATAPRTSCSSTSTASSSTRSGSTAATPRRSTTTRGWTSAASSNGSARTGTRPTRGSGSSARGASTTRTRASCRGSRWSAR